MARPDGITEGRIIHVPVGDNECRPGIIVRDWGDAVNALVFLDGSNDDRIANLNRLVPGAIAWQTSVTFDREARDVYHFHLPTDCPRSA